MPYQETTYVGDADYTINCTGDCVVGDEVRFDRGIFTGSYKKPKFAGYELVSAQIIRESYGEQKQQHTFILETDKGETIRIKGRNLYRNNTYRKPWKNEKERGLKRNEKHQRGEKAREQRRLRKENTTERRL